MRAKPYPQVELKNHLCCPLHPSPPPPLPVQAPLIDFATPAPQAPVRSHADDLYEFEQELLRSQESQLFGLPPSCPPSNAKDERAAILPPPMAALSGSTQQLEPLHDRTAPAVPTEIPRAGQNFETLFSTITPESTADETAENTSSDMDDLTRRFENLKRHFP